jgi:hypothetical protein
MARFTADYNFVRIHKTPRVTPAMAAGMSDRLWEVADIVALVEAAEAPATKRGTLQDGEKLPPVPCRVIREISYEDTDRVLS